MTNPGVAAPRPPGRHAAQVSAAGKPTGEPGGLAGGGRGAPAPSPGLSRLGYLQRKRAEASRSPPAASAEPGMVREASR